MAHVISRQIAIDSGHRIMTHGSKCRHIHGHRYTIEATCSDMGNRLHKDGEQTDMVMDFGFLKDEMMKNIDAPCDHGFITSATDQEILEMFAPAGEDVAAWIETARSEVKRVGFFSTDHTRLQSKLYVITAQPTAECLAQHWFMRLKDRVTERSDGLAKLDKVRVWETPNCWAEYAG